MYHQALTGILTEQKLISDCRYRVIESSSLVPVLFREVFSHPYICLFNLLVNGFSVIIIIIIIINSLPGFSWSVLKLSLLHYTTSYQFPEICAFIIGFSSMCGLKSPQKEYGNK